MAGKFILVGGGARSGKSRFALELALGIRGPRAFVATATPFDDEMAERIARHREERKATFETVDAPSDLRVVAERMDKYEVILLDCLTLYLSNRLLSVPDVERLGMNETREMEAVCQQDVQAGLAALQARCETLIVVTNEVGQGIVPVSRLGRVFRDVAGRINQTVASSASEVWLCAFGLPLRLKPSLCGKNPID